MSLLVSNGTELIRYNTSSADIEFSNNRGMTWFVRSHGRDMGNVRAMTLHKGEIILCSDRGIFYSQNDGRSWFLRTGSEKSFVDLQDMGSELVAVTSDGHVFKSSNKGFYWYKRG